MVEIECLVCGETVKVPDFIDAEDYGGQLVCQECGLLLHVKLVGSKVRQYKVVGQKFRNLEKLLEELRQLGTQSEDK